MDNRAVLVRLLLPVLPISAKRDETKERNKGEGQGKRQRKICILRAARPVPLPLCLFYYLPMTVLYMGCEALCSIMLK